MARVRLKVKVTGIVQGVGFRPFIYRTAVANRLNGYVKNRGDAGVEILLEGEKRNIHSFLRDLDARKPPLAQIYEVMTSKVAGENEHRAFLIERSSDEAELTGSVVPPDIAICNECLEELRNPRDPRFGYFFITCTNCGPRFTTIEKLPYDRENTTMREFPMCDFCLKEYSDPLNRRFHAQTVACPECGPVVYLTDADGRNTNCKDPIIEAGRLLSEGHIVAVKGYGGFHVAASTIRDEPLVRLREVKHRSQKPFAIMARSLEAAATFAEVGKKESELLTSYNRPIVLVGKTRDYCLSGLVAPGLHNVGVMLPYTGLHYMLFDKVCDKAFVMTSANPPNQPIIKDNAEALKCLSSTVDYFLFHNRRIAHRCDDSVVRAHDAHTTFLRRSRGYAPAPLVLGRKAGQCVLALGGELNNTVCVLNGNKAFISQHIGDVENVETRKFLELSAEHLVCLTNSKIDVVACDLHPKFTTTIVAHELATQNGWRLEQLQHHYAHVAALMAEHNVDDIIGISCDGFGYGLGGEAWGGEIILCSKGTPGFKRLAHLERQPLIGGDLATRFPLRIAAGILYGSAPVEDWLLQNKQHFPYGEKEIEIVLQQLMRGKGITETTSCGRVMDAVSAVLDVCYERTYEGEPSIKLESIGTKGKDVLELTPSIKNNILETTPIVKEIFEKRRKYAKSDLAYSAHMYLARGLAALAIEEAEQQEVEDIGFSGGVACNEILSTKIRRIVEGEGFCFFVHEMVPPGDGGLSFGQAVASAFF